MKHWDMSQLTYKGVLLQQHPFIVEAVCTKV